MKKTNGFIFLLPFMAAVISACSNQSVTPEDPPTMPAATPTPTQEVYTDPFAYCAAVGTIDTPDTRYMGAAVPDAVISGYKKAAGLEDSTEPTDMFKETIIWRCMDGEVYACNFGANLPCDSKANTDKNPTQAMDDYCQTDPNSDFIPMYVTGHDTVYDWRCVDGRAEAVEQVGKVDAAGYLADIWYPITNP